jgi:hypothetical protein
MEQRKAGFISSAFRHNFTEADIRMYHEGVIMPRLTGEEYAALDEKWTRETPKVNWSRPGDFIFVCVVREEEMGTTDRTIRTA